MIAVTTKTLGATDYRPTRVSARTEDGVSFTIPFDYEQDVPAQHEEAARVLLRKRLNECAEGKVHSASWKSGYVHVFSEA